MKNIERILLILLSFFIIFNTIIVDRKINTLEDAVRVNQEHIILKYEVDLSRGYYDKDTVMVSEDSSKFIIRKLD